MQVRYHRNLIISIFIIAMISITLMMLIVCLNMNNNQFESGHLEIVSGENVQIDQYQNIKLNFENFEHIGQEQIFSMQLQNNNQHIAFVEMSVQYPSDYFQMNCNPKFVVYPGETKNYTFSVVLTEFPENNNELNFSLTMNIIYQTP